MADTILIVDDNRGMLLTLRHILTAEGYTVLLAGDGAEAIRVAQEQDVDLALIDYRMTGMNGGEACAGIKAARPSIVIYMMTAHVTPEAGEAAVRHGATGILYKPLDIPDLLALLAERRLQTSVPVAGGDP
jgi:two-component system, response regulator, stage 0 sporulation protein F